MRVLSKGRQAAQPMEPTAGIRPGICAPLCPEAQLWVILRHSGEEHDWPTSVVLWSVQPLAWKTVRQAFHLEDLPEHVPAAFSSGNGGRSLLKECPRRHSLPQDPLGPF